MLPFHEQECLLIECRKLIVLESHSEGACMIWQFAMQVRYSPQMEGVLHVLPLTAILGWVVMTSLSGSESVKTKAASCGYLAMHALYACVPIVLGIAAAALAGVLRVVLLGMASRERESFRVGGHT